MLKLQLIFLLLAFVLKCGSGKAASVNVKEVTIPTTCCGSISAKVTGPDDGIPVVAVHGVKELLKEEWLTVATLLGEKGYRVAVLDFHSNAATKPGRISSSDFDSILRDSVTKEYFGAEKAVVMGKSWGGGNVANYGAKNSIHVSKMILAAPSHVADKALSDLKDVGLRVFLAWAEDDPIMAEPRPKLWKETLGDKMKTFTVVSGGHVIFEEYAAPIADFIAS